MLVKIIEEVFKINFKWHTPSKTSAPRMATSHGSPCYKSSSSQTKANGTTKTSDYRPHVLEVDPFLQIQPPGYVMQSQGSYMSLAFLGVAQF
ncbi:hypothetical protein Hanom_Chr03g00200751 [Helianthus anomalus]